MFLSSGQMLSVMLLILMTQQSFMSYFQIFNSNIILSSRRVLAYNYDVGLTGVVVQSSVVAVVLFLSLKKCEKLHTFYPMFQKAAAVARLKRNQC